ncbi:elongation of very long chain fatty acids protein 7-like [Vespa mandarinia]|uniref:elongation of very long chain fatty acids protein 7-like n=1 Tax=Vespa mandarinia TaxID=7446 RepID=UPI00160FC676|nr:elongation of very long chain fatty acids protein 7-like [Vespa mandarinia]
MYNMNLSNIYENIVKDADPRVKLWPLVDSPSTITTIIGIYLISIFIGPKYMNNKPAYSLQRFIQFYNIFQILANSIIIYMFLDAGWYENIFIYCVPITYSTDPNSMKIALAMWYTMILKMIDLIETGIFVLRKKNNQISFLHLYHHVTTALLSWLCIKFYAAGMTTFIPMLNCTVHVIMYGYYFLSSLGKEIQKLILPYKPIMTIIQMVQFVILLMHLLQTFLSDCKVPKLSSFIMIINLIINFLLFLNFYMKSYKNSKTKNK